MDEKLVDYNGRIHSDAIGRGTVDPLHRCRRIAPLAEQCMSFHFVAS
jgi:hypothetical protein